MNEKIKYKYSDTKESPGFLLWQVTMLWQRIIKRELDKLGLTHTQFVLLSVLNWLSTQQEIVTQTDVADNSKVDRVMASKVLRTLETKGFIQRKEHPIDIRANAVLLNEKGFSILQQAIVIVEGIDQKFFGILEKDICEELILLLQNGIE